MSWASGYIGIPWRDLGRDIDGCDCLGLLRLVYLGQTGIELPTYLDLYQSAAERAEAAAIVAGEASSVRWRRVPDQEAGRDLDALIFRRGRLDAHVGIWCGPGLMLHTVEDGSSRVERWHDGYWLRRLTGIYRHRELDR